MAESIYTQLENQTALTPVDGKDFRHELPAGLFPTAEVFESPEQLIEWADERGHTAKLIQKGLQKGIIEVRACFKSSPKDTEWTEELGIANLAKLEWKTVDRPNQGDSKKIDKVRYTDCMAMIGKLSIAQMDKETIKELTSEIYGEDMVEEIFSSLGN